MNGSTLLLFVLASFGLIATGCNSRTSEMRSLCEDTCNKMVECEGAPINCTALCDATMSKIDYEEVSDACYDAGMKAGKCMAKLSCEELMEDDDSPSSPCYEQSKAADKACEGVEVDLDDDDDMGSPFAGTQKAYNADCIDNCTYRIGCDESFAESVTYFGDGCEDYCEMMTSQMEAFGFIQGGQKCVDANRDILACGNAASCDEVEEYGEPENLPSCEKEAKKMEEICSAILDY